MQVSSVVVFPLAPSRHPFANSSRGGPAACAHADTSVIAANDTSSNATRVTSMMARPSIGARLRAGEDALPVVLHVDHRPLVCRRGIQRLVELADVGFAVVGVFAFRVGVMHDQAEARASARE